MTKLLINLIQIRGIQLYRILKQLGWLYTAVLLGILIFAIVILFNGNGSNMQTYTLSTVGILVTASIHFNRKDKLIFQSISKTSALLYLVEYFFLQSLIYLFHLLKGNWFHIIVLLSATLVIVFLTKDTLIKSRKNIRFKWPINASDFEWISGLRRNFPILMFMYLLAFFSVTVPFLSLLFVWYLSLSIASFYKEAEPLQILLANNRKVNDFLTRKILAHQRNYWQFIIPILLVYSYFHWEHVIIVLILIIFICIGLIFTVANKYATYIPEKYVGNDLLNALVFGAVLIPFLAPLPILLTIRSVIKAKRNLKSYVE